MEKSKSAYNFEVGHITLTIIGNYTLRKFCSLTSLSLNQTKKKTTLPDRVFKIEITDHENGDKGEAVYYLENTDYVEH